MWNIDFDALLIVFKKVNNDEYAYHGLALANDTDKGYEIITSKVELPEKIMPKSSHIHFAKSSYDVEISTPNEFVYLACQKKGLKDFADFYDKEIYEYIEEFVDSAYQRYILSRKEDNTFKLQVARKPINNTIFNATDVSEDFLEEQNTEVNFDIEQKKEIDINKIMADVKKKFIAQEEVVESITSNLYVNQLLINNGDKDLISTSKSAILLDGPTGTGKTAIIKEVADKLNLPVVITKSTDYSAAGYVGSKLSDILVKLLKQANGDLELAQRGIVCMDEFDKLAGEDKNRALVMKSAVQQDLLTFIGGSKYNIQTGFSFYGSKQKEFDTTNLTFIGMGAFTEILESKKANKNESTLGFGSHNQETNNKNAYVIEDKDYVDYGLERELVGRLHLKIHTNAYMKEDFKRILLESEISPLKMFIKTVKALGIKDVTYDDEFIDEVATISYDMGFGVRGLQKIFADIKNYFLMDIINKEYDEINLTTEMLNKIKEKNVRKF